MSVRVINLIKKITGIGLPVFFILSLSLSTSLKADDILDAEKECDEDFSESNDKNPGFENRYTAVKELCLARARCIDCSLNLRYKPGGWEVAGNILESLLPPLAYIYSQRQQAKTMTTINKMWSNAYARPQEAWAKAYQGGQDACNARFNRVLQYTLDTGTPPMTPEQMSGFCNGAYSGVYPGFNGYNSNGVGGVGNPWHSAGYSSGFLQGMISPYCQSCYLPGSGFGGGAFGGGGFGTGFGGGQSFNSFPGGGIFPGGGQGFGYSPGGLGFGGSTGFGNGYYTQPPYGYGSPVGQGIMPWQFGGNGSYFNVGGGFGNQYGGQFGNQYGGQFGNQNGGQFGGAQSQQMALFQRAQLNAQGNSAGQAALYRNYLSAGNDFYSYNPAQFGAGNVGNYFGFGFQ